MKDRSRRRRAAVLGLAAVSLVGAAGVTDANGGHAERSAQPRAHSSAPSKPVTEPRAREDAFDWVDAGIGGAAVLGLTLVTAGTSLVVLRRRPQRVLVDIQSLRKEQVP
jgi:hypothetical protein